MSHARQALAIIGNPDSRRIRLFQERLQQHSLPAARVIDYRELLAGVPLSRFVSHGAHLRIESPGESFEVEQALLRAGAAAAVAEDAPGLSEAQVDALAEDKGRIRHPRQWYLGYRALLRELDKQGRDLELHWTTTPCDIALLFDKPRAQANLAAHGVPVPQSLGRVDNFRMLREAMRERGMQRVFVKLAHGSSASGVVALRLTDDKMHAVSTVELVRNGGEVALYNSLKLRRYNTRREISCIIDRLCAEGVQVEQWLPKAAGRAGNFDLRVLVVAGRARLQVMRVNPAPMTNLHLGSQRGDVVSLRRDMGEARWHELLEVAEQAAGVFPHALHVGVDVMLMPGLRRPHVLETNAFGDLLPGVTADGLDAYGHQLAALYPAARRWKALA